MNNFVAQISPDLRPGGLATVATLLLDNGAEFEMFGASSLYFALMYTMIRQATFADLIDGKLKEVRYLPYTNPFL